MIAHRLLMVAGALIALSCIGTHAAATPGLEPVQLYNLINRPLRVIVSVPAPATTGPHAPAEPAPPTSPAVEIELIRPADPGSPGTAVARAAALPGPVDLSTLFPLLWTRIDPELLCAQLVLGGVRTGPPLVLQPMRAQPRAAALDPKGATVRFTAPAKPLYTGLRIYVDHRIQIDTTLGSLTLALRPDCAPNSAWHFRSLVAGGFYAGTGFHRVIAGTPSSVGATGGPAPFMVQAGDPLGTGTGGPGFAIALEDSPLPHGFGVAALARQSQPDSAGSQFYIALSRAGTAGLDGAYATFAQLVAGADTLRAIAAARVDPADKPVEPITITAARLLPAPPVGSGPGPEREPAPPSGTR